MSQTCENWKNSSPSDQRVRAGKIHSVRNLASKVEISNIKTLRLLHTSCKLNRRTPSVRDAYVKCSSLVLFKYPFYVLCFQERRGFRSCKIRMREKERERELCAWYVIEEGGRRERQREREKELSWRWRSEDMRCIYKSVIYFGSRWRGYYQGILFWAKAALKCVSTHTLTDEVWDPCAFTRLVRAWLALVFAAITLDTIFPRFPLNVRQDTRGCPLLISATRVFSVE